MDKKLRIALVGNPNCGKTSVFNLLTGLRQRTGNFPGITVDKKIGNIQLSENFSAELIDLPGTYSLYPLSSDERVVIKSLLQKSDPNYPDLIIYIVDSTQLEKNLLLFSQIRDLEIPIVMALNMTDIATAQNMDINSVSLSKKIHTPVVKISGRTGEGLSDLKQSVIELHKQLPIAKEKKCSCFYQQEEKESIISNDFQKIFPEYNLYQCLIIAHHYHWLPISDIDKEKCKAILEKNNFDGLDAQVNETMQRYATITPIANEVINSTNEKKPLLSKKLDQVLTNNKIGILLFFFLMAIVFQSIFQLASYPMDLIDAGMGTFNDFAKEILPAGWFTDLITDGIIAGIAGVVIFIPQIAILFLFITIMEEVGYLARVAYMLDSVMRKFGLNGRSVIALISSGACAIPAIMSARTISNPKERLLTILVSPFISCSARIPVYAVLVAFVVPSKTVLGFLNLQGLVFMSLYLLGIVAALLASFIINKMIANHEPSFLLLELPEYKMPLLRNVLLAVWQKIRQFVFEAGKVILVISILLWFLATYGPTKKMNFAESSAIEYAQQNNFSAIETEDLIASKKLEASYIGHLGKFIEPAIEPLGYDWKIGIALITSFAAREVFVGTMATIYSIGSEDNESSIQEKMHNEINAKTGEKRFTVAVALSLLVFYVFAMQCMATLAVVYRETKTWKYPIYQFVFMTTFAYIASLIVYQILK